MSTLIVEVCQISEILPHPNADALELTVIKGWQSVVQKGIFKAGDKVTYIPIDSVIPLEHSERWGITKYLSNGRVRCAKLRGEPSFGVVLVPEQDWEIGADVKDFYGITKYIPPFKADAGDAEPSHPLLSKFTDVENMRNFPTIIKDGEPVVVTEKIHGTCCRVGILEGIRVGGSMELQRTKPALNNISTYWYPWTLIGVEAMLEVLAVGYKQVILFGEVFGSSIQSLSYGKKGGYGFAAFGLMLEGKFVDFPDFEKLCETYHVTMVPVLYRGPFSLAKIVELSKGNTTLDGDHIREGVVVVPEKERRDPKIGRVCLKYIGDQYLLGKNISDTNDV